MTLVDVAQTKRGVVEVVCNAMATRNLHFLAMALEEKEDLRLLFVLKGVSGEIVKDSLTKNQRSLFQTKNCIHTNVDVIG